VTPTGHASAKTDGIASFPSTTGTIREATNVRNRARKPFTKQAGHAWDTFRTLLATCTDGHPDRALSTVISGRLPSFLRVKYMDDLVLRHQAAMGEHVDGPPCGVVPGFLVGGQRGGSAAALGTVESSVGVIHDRMGA
jgi:hypothetical protein